MHRTIIGTLFVLFAVIFSDMALAVAKDARVAFVRGTVTATDKSINLPRLLQRDSRVEVGEIIDTGPKGLVQLVFPDSSMLYIKANSSVKPVSYTHLTLPTMLAQCRSRWSRWN